MIFFFFLLFLTYISIWIHKYLCFRVKFGARIRAKFFSFSYLLSSTSAKLLTSFILNLLLYFLLAAAGVRARRIKLVLALVLEPPPTFPWRRRLSNGV